VAAGRDVPAATPCYPAGVAAVEGQAVKRLALLALMLASSSVVAAPAPVPKPQRGPERPAARQGVAHVPDFDPRGAGFARWRVVAQPAAVFKVPAQEPAQPPDAAPPGKRWP
jgi:hypothetical protein